MVSRMFGATKYCLRSVLSSYTYATSDMSGLGFVRKNSSLPGRPIGKWLMISRVVAVRSVAWRSASMSSKMLGRAGNGTVGSVGIVILLSLVFAALKTARQTLIGRARI